MNYKKILLKLSGEMLKSNNKHILSKEQLIHYAREIIQVHQQGVSIAIVLGGGNIYRGGEENNKFAERIEGDHMGMLATMINSIALYNILIQHKTPVRLMSAINIQHAYEPYSRAKALSYLQKGNIVMIGGGLGKPCFTTDSAASLYAIELGMDVLVKGTQVDGIYSADPKKYTTATRYTHITIEEALEKKLQIMDMTALNLCAEARLPIIVYNASKAERLKEVLNKPDLGTFVQV